VTASISVPSLRGAQRRSNPFFLCAARWIASWSLSSGAHSRDPLARKTALQLNCLCSLKMESGTCTGGGAPPLPLWERVGVRGRGLSMERNPSPGSHLSMRCSRSFASASFSENGRQRRPMLSHKGRGDISISVAAAGSPPSRAIDPRSTPLEPQSLKDQADSPMLADPVGCRLFEHWTSSASRILLLASNPKVRSQPSLASSVWISFQLSYLPVFAR